MSAQPLTVMQIISDLGVGGAQEMVRTLSQSLAEAGCRSVVCTFRDGPLRGEIERAGIPVVILAERRHSVFDLPHFLGEVSAIRRRLREVIREHQVDVLQTHLLRSLDFLVLSLRGNPRPRVFWTFHNSSFDLRADHLEKHSWLLRPKRFSHHILYRLGSQWADGLVAVSEDVRGAILDTMPGIPPDKITIIPNCVDIDRYGISDGRERFRRSLGFQDSDHLMTAVATFKRQKGHRFLLEAAMQLMPRHPRLHMLFVGDGDLRGAIETLAAGEGLDDRILFLGTRSDVPQILAASDSFVLPSLWEGLPMALIEAMASGLPIIATDVSGTRDVMVPGETGVLVPPGNSESLVQAIETLMKDPARGRRMGAAARRRVSTQYGSQRQASEYIALYLQESPGRSTPLLSKQRLME
jgi:glycosyltransferase involved in cell wall biosynthesis